MSRKTVSAYVETEVDVDLDDFDVEDICDFLEDKGFTIIEGKHTALGIEKFEDIDKRIWQLYLVYTACSEPCKSWSDIKKELDSFFADYYNKVSV
jgi:uncharacterized protein (DUF2164 family)